jgi:hypothetical protein
MKWMTQIPRTFLLTGIRIPYFPSKIGTISYGCIVELQEEIITVESIIISGTL